MERNTRLQQSTPTSSSLLLIRKPNLFFLSKRLNSSRQSPFQSIVSKAVRNKTLLLPLKRQQSQTFKAQSVVKSNKSVHSWVAGNVSESLGFGGQKILGGWQRLMRILGRYDRRIFLSMMLFGSSVVGFFQMNRRYSQINTDSPFTQTLSSQAQTQAESALSSLFGNETIQQEGIAFMDRMVQHPDAHNSMLYLSKTAVKDSRFVDESRIYGVQLSQDLAMRPEVIRDSRQLVVESFTSDARVISAQIEVLKYFVQHPETMAQTQEFMTDLMLADPLYETWLSKISDGLYQAIQQDAFQNEFKVQMNQVASSDSVYYSMMSSLVYQPLTNLMTLGLYSLVIGSAEPLPE